MRIVARSFRRAIASVYRRCTRSLTALAKLEIKSINDINQRKKNALVAISCRLDDSI